MEQQSITGKQSTVLVQWQQSSPTKDQANQGTNEASHRVASVSPS